MGRMSKQEKAAETAYEACTDVLGEGDKTCEKVYQKALAKDEPVAPKKGKKGA